MMDFLKRIVYEKKVQIDLSKNLEGEEFALAKIREIRIKLKNYYRKSSVKEYCQQHGVTEEVAEKRISQAMEKLGIKYQSYYNDQVYLLPEDNLEDAYAEILAEKKKKEKEEKNNMAYYTEAIMNKTGWTKEETVAKVSEARKRIGCSYEPYFYKEYFMFNLYNMTDAEQDRVALYYHSQNLVKKFDVNKEFVRILKNKEETSIYFSEYMQRAWGINSLMTYDEFKERFQNVERIIYKPRRGHKGEGVVTYTLGQDTDLHDVYENLYSLPVGIVEEYVVQHPHMSELVPSSVNTLRVVTVSSKDEPITSDGKNMDILYTTLRIGGGTSVVDNFHGGGMCAVADKKTGKLITNGCDMEGHVFEKHPMTGVTIKGFEIPFYQEALEMVKEAMKKSLVQGYLGWDVAITQDGPTLIEVNTIPGIVLLSTPFGSEKMDSLSVLEPYI